MYFCIRDDDTSFFTTPEELEKAYGEITKWGPVSLAVVPFHKAGTSKGVPTKFRGRWTTHPLHENSELVSYLRQRVSEGRFEIMLHGYHHDEIDKVFEFARGKHLSERVLRGKKYLEDLLETKVRVFVPPRNLIGREGLNAIAASCLHLGGVAGVRSGWSLLSHRTWSVWFYLYRWRRHGGVGIPWILDLGDHREIAGNPVTPSASFKKNQQAIEFALEVGGAFCLATHYWELSAPSKQVGDPSVDEHLRYFTDRVRADPKVIWRSVGDVVSLTTPLSVGR